jgi:hypothetical protein
MFPGQQPGRKTGEIGTRPLGSWHTLPAPETAPTFVSICSILRFIHVTALRLFYRVI